MKQLATISASVPLIAVAGTALADPGYMGDYDHMMWGGGLLGGAMMLLFWGALIALIVFAVRWFSDGGRGPGIARRDDPLETLRDRFARGEIEEDEFKRRKAALES